MTKSTEIKHKTALVLEGWRYAWDVHSRCIRCLYEKKKILSLMQLLVCQQAHYLV